RRRRPVGASAAWRYFAGYLIVRTLVDPTKRRRVKGERRERGGCTRVRSSARRANRESGIHGGRKRAGCRTGNTAVRVHGTSNLPLGRRRCWSCHEMFKQYGNRHEPIGIV